MRWLGAALMVVTLAACQAAQASTATSVNVAEFSIDVAASALTAGSIRLDVSNSGEFPHMLVVEHIDGTVVYATDPVPSGADAAVDVTLEVGSYRFTCRIVAEKDGGEIVDHFERGMVATVDVVAVR